MSLATELAQLLNASGSITGLQGDSTDALTEMEGVSLPEVSTDIDQSRQQSGAIDLSAITSGVQQALSDLSSGVANLPVANDVLGPVSGAIDLAAQLSELDLPNSVTELAASIDTQLSGSDDFLGKLNCVSDLLAGNPNMTAARNLLAALADMTGSSLNADDLQAPNLLPAVQAAAQTVGGLMSLHYRLEDANRLAEVVKTQLDAEQIAAGVEQVEKQLAMDGSIPLSQLLQQLDVGNATDVAVAKQAITNVAAPVVALRTAIAEGMAFGEATLTHLDPNGLKLALQASSQQIMVVDLSPLETAIAGLGDKIRPLFAVDFDSAPAASLEDWLTSLEGRVTDLASSIAAYDIQSLTAPITEGIETVMAIPSALTRALQSLRLTIQEALDSIRSVIESVPLEAVANTIRQVLAPIAGALSFIGDLVARIQAVLTTAVTTLQSGLDITESAVDTVKEELEKVFQKLKQYVDKLNLESVLGEVAEQIENFAQLLGQADMSPYFDTVADTINSTAGVVDNVPFSLLPDSMEQDLVDLIRPVKQVNLDAFKGDIKTLVQIGPDGKFSLRPELEDALSGIQDKYEELLGIIRDGDPRKLLAEIDAELDKLTLKIEELTPSVALEPLQQVIDEIKSVIGSFDLNATLAPLNDGFDEILTKVNEFKPSILLQDAENELSVAREAVFGALQLDRWQEELTRLRTQALALLDPMDPNQLEPLLQNAVNELKAQTSRLPQLELGYLIGSLVNSVVGGSFGQSRSEDFNALLEWMQHGGGTSMLTSLARDASGSIDAASNTVQQVDPQAIVLRLQPVLGEIHTALEGLPDGDAKTQLQQCAAVLEVEVSLGGFSPHRQRYLDALQQASGSFIELANTGLSEVDISVSRLCAVLGPLDFMNEFLRKLLAVIGIEGLDQGLQQLVNSSFEVATPARLAGIFTPLFLALKGRVEALLDGFLNPVLDAISDLQSLKEQLSLSGLMEDLDEVHGSVVSQIKVVHPEQLLGDSVTAFNDTQSQVLAFDPLGPINDAITALQTSSVRVLEKLDGEEILKTPLAIYDDIFGAMESLNLEQLLEPVLDALDSLSEKVSQGLDDTVDSFERLQDALPDQVGSTSLSASASVST